MPRRTKDFATSPAAQFWFEWRHSGLMLPVSTLFVVAVIFGRISWIFRHDADFTVDTLPKILATPLVLAFVIGKGFIKPDLGSMNLSVPSFLAVRPISSGEIVASKMKVAAWSVALAWVFVFGFLGLWLPFWANRAGLNDSFLTPCVCSTAHSWVTIILLSILALAVLTWRLMVNGLWAGLSWENASITMVRPSCKCWRRCLCWSPLAFGQMRLDWRIAMTHPL